ncbi:alpha/beta fold hydrolase [Aurantimonas sp. Leaf443]|uniref:alpha/beta fold hydrolase n=1 Tax=Aurantimonas sp. Leaf443 TaxID=1736378 RepID=UPI0006F3C37B|nr:alpha/beta fold hydrolase [Aurantimonas sp. Leaf443]KQT83944.1 hypothetical protein ASG48_11190 [Aurantimonas sp. Leaf443]
MQRSIEVTVAGSRQTVDCDESGSGETLVLLPALSTISTRREMAPLAERLSQRFRTLAYDWPGFGDAPKRRADWAPADLCAFLEQALAALPAPPKAIVAAGHAATYALRQAAEHPGSVERLVLVAPTWRGPFPTMLKDRRPPWLARLRAAVDAPLAGQALYRLNVSGPMIAKMTREHVFEDEAFLSGARMAEKRAVTAAKGARHASVRFVTGALDPVTSREAFLDLARRAGVPILVVLGEGSPAKSRAEMEALAALPGVATLRLAKGRLSLHEEFPDAVAAAIAPFLAGEPTSGGHARR